METRAEFGTETEMETRAEFGTEMKVGVETETSAKSKSKSESETETETESRGETDSAMEATSKLREIKYHSSRRLICKLSDPALPHTLFRVYAGQRSSSECFSCKEPISLDFEYSYHCFTCRLDFHNACHHYPPEIRHPFHLQHPLTITFSHPQTRPDFRLHVGCEVSYTKASRSDGRSDDDDSDSEPDLSVMKCKCCQRNLGDTYYACSICAFTLHLSCAKFSPLTIQRPMSTPSPSYLEKTHPHVLLVECHCVGRVIRFMFASFVTTWCIVNASNCPVLSRSRVIRIVSLIRLLFLPWISLVVLTLNCGQYSCTVGCLYSVHSKCATRKDVWDGIELEGVPLEKEVDIPPFERIDDQTIRHFNHEHYLRFHGNDDDYDIREEIKFCQACVLPIIYDPFYSCMQCNFVLHEECANRSLKIHHPLHVHPLNIVLMRPLSFASKCRACNQKSLGFFYKCREKYCYFQIDARCASIPEPFNHKSHPHPLYFTLRKGSCMRCHKEEGYHISLMECIECNSFLCLGCATLADVAIYKHLLTLCYGEENTSGTYWCEICEGELDAKMWFYRCQECSHTLHIRCVLGPDTYLKPGRSFQDIYLKVNILLNSGNSRPVCETCGLRCKYPQFFKIVRASKTYCSYGGCMDSLEILIHEKNSKEAEKNELDIEKAEVIGNSCL